MQSVSSTKDDYNAPEVNSFKLLLNSSQRTKENVTETTIDGRAKSRDSTRKKLDMNLTRIGYSFGSVVSTQQQKEKIANPLTQHFYDRNTVDRNMNFPQVNSKFNTNKTSNDIYGSQEQTRIQGKRINKLPIKNSRSNVLDKYRQTQPYFWNKDKNAVRHEIFLNYTKFKQYKDEGMHFDDNDAMGEEIDSYDKGKRLNSDLSNVNETSHRLYQSLE